MNRRSVSTSEGFWRARGKRILDLALALPALAAVTPAIAVAAFAIVVESGRPAFFRQVRVGQDEDLFVVYKLRTMVVANRPQGQTYNTSDGVTRVGRVLRASKLDEVPQLWNVVKGEMSLVGPRPCLPTTRETMTAAERARFRVKPGLTGLAQVNGNVRLTWPERCRYDVEYTNDVTFRRDASIILKTLAVVIGGKA